MLSFNVPPDDATVVSHGLRGLTDVSGIARDRHKRMPVALSLTRDVLGFGLEWAARRDVLEASAAAVNVAAIESQLTQFGSRCPAPPPEPTLPDELDDDKPTVKLAKRMIYDVMDKYFDSVREGHAALVQLARTDALVSAVQTFAKAESKRKKKAAASAAAQADDTVMGSSGVAMSRSLSDSQTKPPVASTSSRTLFGSSLPLSDDVESSPILSPSLQPSASVLSQPTPPGPSDLTHFSLDSNVGDVISFIQPLPASVPPVAPMIATSSEQTISALLEFAVTNQSLEHLLFVVSLCMKESTVFTGPASVFSLSSNAPHKASSQLLSRSVPWLLQLLSSLPRDAAGALEDPVSQFVPKCVDDTTDQPGILAMWLLACLHAGSSAYLATQRDSSTLNAACNKPIPSDVLSIFVAPSTVVLLQLRQLCAEVTGTLTRCNDSVASHFVSTCLLSLITVLQGVLHCVVYHGPRPDSSAKLAAMRDLSEVSGGVPSLSRRASPRRAGQSPLLQSSPAMGPSMDSLSSQSPFHTPYAGAFPPPLSLQSRSSSFEAGSFDFPVCNLNDVYTSLRNVLETTLFTLKQTVVVPRVSPAVAKAPQPSAALQSVSSSTPRGVVAMVPGEADADNTPGLDAAPRPVTEDLEGFGAAVKPPKFKLHDDDAADASSVDSDDGELPHPLQQCAAFGSNLDTDGVLQRVAAASQRAWCAGVRVLYPTPVQRHILLRCCLDVLSDSPVDAEPSPPMFSASASVAKATQTLLARSCVELFCAQDLAHTVLVSYIPLGSSIRDNDRFGTSLWQKRDTELLRMLVAMSSRAGDGTSVFVSLLAAIQRGITRVWWRPMLEYPAVAAAPASASDVALEDADGARPSGVSRRFTNTPLVTSTQSPGLLTTATPSFSGLPASSANWFVTDAVSPFALGPAVPVQSLPFGLVDYDDNDDTPLLLDPARCAECISITGNGSQGRQIVDKTWGVVLSSVGFAPNTGLHAWDIKVRKCDRSYMSIGIATRETATSSHLGSDKFSWGMMGSKGLWYNRSKLKASYGKDLRTGMVVRVTYDSDNGTLTFGLHNAGGSGISSWGLAFKDLKGSGTLYPAVCLYNRNDEFSIKRVPASQLAAKASASVVLGTANANTPVDAFMTTLVSTRLREASAAGCWHELSSPVPTLLVDYAVLVMEAAVSALDAVTAQFGSSVVAPLFHSLARMPVERFSLPAALILQPVLSRLVEAVSTLPLQVPMRPLLCDGGWELRSSLATSSNTGANGAVTATIQPQTYGAALQYCGDHPATVVGKGKSSNMSILGSVHGSWLRFTETWNGGSVCVITARVSSDGTSFYGFFTDSELRAQGTVVGDCFAPSTPLDSLQLLRSVVTEAFAVVNCAVCCGNAAADEASRIALASMYARSYGGNGFRDALTSSVPPTPQHPSIATIMDVSLEDFSLLRQQLPSNEAHLPRPLVDALLQPNAVVPDSVSNSMQWFLPNADELALLLSGKSSKPSSPAPVIAEVDVTMSSAVEGGAPETKDSDMMERENKDDDVAASVPADPVIAALIAEDGLAQSAGSSNGVIRPRKEALHVAEEWLASPMFAGGLRSDVTKHLFLQAISAVVHTPCEPNVELLPCTLRTATDALTSVSDALMFEDDVTLPNVSAVKSFIEGDSPCDDAILSAAGIRNKVVKRMSPTLQAARRAVFVVLLHHSDKLMELLSVVESGTFQEFAAQEEVKTASQHSQVAVLKLRETALSAEFEPTIPVEVTQKATFAAKECIRRCHLLLTLARVPASLESFAKWVLQFVTIRLECHELCHAIRQLSLGVAAKSLCRLFGARAVSRAVKFPLEAYDMQHVAFGMSCTLSSLAKLAWTPKASLKVSDSWLGRESVVLTGLSGVTAVMLRNIRAAAWYNTRQLVASLRKLADSCNPSHGSTLLSLLGSVSTVLDFTKRAGFAEDAREVLQSGIFDALFACVGWCVAVSGLQASVDGHGNRLGAPAVDVAHWPLVRNCAIAVLHGLLAQLSMFNGAETVTLTTPLSQPSVHADYQSVVADPDRGKSPVPAGEPQAVTDAVMTTLQAGVSTYVRLLERCIVAFNHTSNVKHAGDVRLNTPARNRVSLGAGQSNEAHIEFVQYAMLSNHPVFEGIAYSVLSSLATCAHGKLLQTALVSSNAPATLLQLVLCNGVSRRVQKHGMKVLRAVLPAVAPESLLYGGVSLSSPIHTTVAADDALEAAFGLDRLGWAFDSDGDVPMAVDTQSSHPAHQFVLQLLDIIATTHPDVSSVGMRSSGEDAHDGGEDDDNVVVEEGDTEQPSGPSGVPPEEDEEFLLAQALALSMGEEFPPPQPAPHQPSHAPSSSPQPPDTTNIPVGDAVLVHGQFLKHAVVLASYAANRTLRAMRVFSRSTVSSHDRLQGTQPGLVIDSALANDAVALLRQLLASSSWHDVLESVFVAATSDANCVLTGDFDSLSDVSAKAVLSRHVGCNSNQDDTGHVVGTLGYESCETLDVLCHWTDKIKMDPVQKVLRRGWAVLSVLGGTLSHIRLGCAVRKRDGLPWMQPPDETTAAQSGSAPAKHKTASQLAPKPSDYDVSIGPAVTVIIQSQGVVTFEASKTGQTLVSLSGNGVGLCGAAPGLTYADEIGVDVFTDLAPRGSDVGIVVGLVGPAAAHLNIKSPEVDVPSGIPRGLAAIAKAQKGEPHVEVAVKGSVGSAYVVRVGYEDVVAFEEIPVPVDSVMCRQFVTHVLRSTLPCLFTTIFEEEACGLDATDPSNQPSGRKRSLRTGVTVESPKEHDLPMADGIAALGHSDVLSPDWLCADGNVDETVFDVRLARACHRVSALKSTNTLLLQHPDVMTAFVADVVSGVQRDSAGDVSLWSFKQLLARAGCLTQTCGVSDVGEVEAVFALLLEGLRMQCNHADARTLDQMCSIMEHVASVGLESPSKPLKLGKVIAGAPSRSPAELTKVLKTVTNALRRLRESAASPSEASDDTDVEAVAREPSPIVAQLREELEPLVSFNDTASVGSGQEGADAPVMEADAPAPAPAPAPAASGPSPECAMMMDMGFPREWAEYALQRTGGDMQQSLNFLFEHEGDMDGLLAEAAIAASARAARQQASRAAQASASNSDVARRLVDMGFPMSFAVQAVAAVPGPLEATLGWVVQHPDVLITAMQSETGSVPSPGLISSLMGRAAASVIGSGGSVPGPGGDRSLSSMLGGLFGARMGAQPTMTRDASARSDAESGLEGLLRELGGGPSDDGPRPRFPPPRSGLRPGLQRDTSDGSTDPTMTQEAKDARKASVQLPDPFGSKSLQSVAGTSVITDQLEVDGTHAQGFRSVGAKQVLLTSGKWYYEVFLNTSGVMQIGWADGAFKGDAVKGEGVGDDLHSWAYDGARRYIWHQSQTSWGAEWRVGDIIGCAIDIDKRVMSFSRNGSFEPPMGTSFVGFEFSRGLYPCASLSSGESVTFNFGGPAGSRQLCYELPFGCRPIHEAFGEFPAPKLGLPRYCLGSITEDALEEIEDHLEAVAAAVETSELQHMVSAGGLMMAVPGSSSVTQIVEGRYFGPGGGGRGFTGHGWGGNSDNFPEGVVSEPRSDVQPSKFTLIDVPIDTTAQLIALIASASAADLRQYILFTAHTLSVLYCRSIVAGLFSVGGQKLFANAALLAHPMFASEDDPDVACSDEGNTVLSSFLRVLKLVSWKGFGLTQRTCNELLQLTMKAEGVCHPALTASHVIQLFEPALRAGMLKQYTDWLAAKKVASLGMTAQQLMSGDLASDVPSLVVSLLKLLEANVTAAALPALSKVAWRSCDTDGLPEVAAGLVSLSENTFWCDTDAYSLPNVLFASWLSSLLMELATICRSASIASPGVVETKPSTHVTRNSPRTSGVLHHALAVTVLNTWVIALRSANMSLKEIASRAIAGILRDATEDVRVMSVAIADAGAVPELLSAQQWRVEMLSVYLRTMDPLRIHQLTVNRMESERKQGPVKSLYLQAITDLDAIVQTAVQLVSPSPPNDGLDSAIAEGLLAAIADITALGDGVVASTSSSDSKVGEGDRESKDDVIEAETPRAHLTLSAAIDQLKAAGLSRGKPWLLLAVGGGFGPEIDVAGDMDCAAFSGSSSLQPFAGKDVQELMGDNVFALRTPSSSPSSLSAPSSSGVSVGPLSRVIRIGQSARDGSSNEDPLLHPGIAFRLQLFDESDPVRVNVCGVVDLPDFRASVAVSGFWLPSQPSTPSISGVLLLMEREIVYGNAGIGWKTRYGHNYWAPGSLYVLSCDKPIASNGCVNWPRKLSGTTVVFNYSGEVVMTGEVTAQTSRLFTFDPLYKHRKIDVAQQHMTAVMNSSTDRALVLGSVGFSKGVHYWEVHVGAADHGGLFIGVCPKPAKDAQDVSSVVSRWSGWGFVNFRATMHKSTEKVYGEFFNAGDIIGVKLDMDQGTISFFLDGLRFGEHVLADMGVAYEKLADQSFSDKVNVVLYPCIGFKKRNDKVSLTGKYVSLPGYTSESLAAEANLLSVLLPEWGSPLGHARREVSVDVAELLTRAVTAAVSARQGAPIDHYASVVNTAMTQFATGAYQRYSRWVSCRYTRVKCRAGIFVDLDCSAAAFERIESSLRAQQRVKIRHHWTDQTMDTPEEAVVLGVYNGCVWYRLKKAGGSEGSDTAASLAWYWLPEELPLLEVLEELTLPVTTEPFADPQLSREQFYTAAGLAGRSHHNTDTDRMLVALVNSACDVASVDPVNLRPGALLKHADLAKSSGVWKRSDAIFKWDTATLLSRFCVLLHLNQMLARVVPYMSLSPKDSVGFMGAGCASVIRQQHRCGSGGMVTVHDLFVGTGRWHGCSLGSFVRTHRNVMFTATKLSFWNAVVSATTTPTPLSQDEYEEPREIRLVKINRGPRSSKQALTNISNINARVKRSVFGQLYAEVKTWNLLDNSLRRSFLGKGHGGQRRAFKVKFVGEGVNDYGGPYRAVFEQIVDELQAEISPTQCLLPFLSPSAKRASGVTDPLQGGVFNLSTADLTLDAHMLDYLSFFGRVLGVAVRHGMQLGLALPRWFWRVLAGAPLTSDEIAAIDALPEKQLAAVLMGLASILPLELFQLFDSGELETLFCGTDDVSVDFLRSVTEYDGVSPTDPHIIMFWEVLSEFTPAERSQFLRFVWARSRLPSSAAYLATPFKLQRPSSAAQEKPDEFLPTAQTCFFSLSLPMYTRKQDLRDKLLYAVTHSPNMDADVRLSNAEGWADA